MEKPLPLFILISIALSVFFLGAFVASSSVEGAAPWPCRGHDSRHTGQSQYVAAQKAECAWSYPTVGDINSSPAIGADGTVYVGSDDKYLYAINPDGSPKWKYLTIGCIGSSPAIGSDGTIYVGSGNKLYALNPSDGGLKWSYDTMAKITISSSPIIGADGTIYVVSDVGNDYMKLHAIKPDGKFKWSYSANGYRPSDCNYIRSSPVIGTDGTVYMAGSGDGSLYALNPSDVSLKWARSIGGYIDSSPAVGADSTVYVGSDNSQLYALDPSNGSIKWKQPLEVWVHSSPAISMDGTIYVGSGNGKLYALDSNDNGSPKWSYPTGGAINSSPAIGADGTIYVGSSDKKIYALDPYGSLKWSYTTGGAVDSSPAIGADGTVYIGSDDDKLYAFSLDPAIRGETPPQVTDASISCIRNGAIASLTGHYTFFDADPGDLENTDPNTGTRLRWYHFIPQGTPDSTLGGTFTLIPAHNNHPAIEVDNTPQDCWKLCITPHDGKVYGWPPDCTSFTIPSPLVKPALISPADNAEVSCNPTFQWSQQGVSHDCPYTFDLLIGLIDVIDGPSLPLPVYISDVDVAGGTSYKPSGDKLLEDGTYLWAIRARNCFSEVVESVTRTIRVRNTPPAPLLVSPLADAYTNSQPVFTWTLTLPPAQSAPADVTCTLYLDGQKFKAGLTAAGGWTYSLTEGEALAKGSHTWRVEAAGCMGASASSGTDRRFTVDNTAPCAFDLLLPGGRVPDHDHQELWPAWINADMVTFSWEEAIDIDSGTDHYELWFNNEKVADVKELTAKKALKDSQNIYFPEGQYPWKVVAVDGAGNKTESASIHTLGIDRTAPYAAAVHLLNGQAADLVSRTNRPDFTWIAARDALSGIGAYKLIIDNETISQVDGDVLTYTSNEDLTEGIHTLVIRAIDLAGNARDSAAAGLYIDTSLPKAPLLSSPEQGGYVSSPTPHLCWYPATDNANGSGIGSYEVFVDGAPFAGTIVRGVGDADPICKTGPCPEGLHTWYVVAYDKTGWSARSQERTFIEDTHPPLDFYHISPADGDTIPTLYPQFCWQPTTDVGSVAGSGLDHYELIITAINASSPLMIIPVTSPPPSGGGASGDLTEVCFRLKSPLGQGSYIWLVKAYDRAGQATAANGGAGWQVTLNADLTPPSCTVTAPADNALLCAGVPLVLPLTLSGTAADNPRGSGVVKVELCFDNECPIIWHKAQLDGQGPLFTWRYTQVDPPDGQHTVKVRATDLEGNKEQPASVRTYKIDRAGPRAFQLLWPEDESWQTAQPKFSWEPATDANSPMGHYEIIIWSAQEPAQEGESTQPGIQDREEGLDDAVPLPVGLATQYQSAEGRFDQGAYLWTVRALDICGNATYASRTRIFRVDSQSPLAFSLTGQQPSVEIDGFSWSSARQITLSWATAIDKGAGLADTPYDLFINKEKKATTVEHTYIFQPPVDGRYEWYVVARDKVGNSARSANTLFFQADLSGPSAAITAPGPGSYQGAEGFRLTGVCSDNPDDGSSGVAGVEVTRDGGQTWLSAQFSDQGHDRQWWIDCPVSANGPITFAVRAKDRAGNFTPVEERPSLTVIADVTPPQNFALLSPEDGTWCPTATPTFQWETANDNGSGVVRYTLLFDDNNTRPVEITLGAVTSYTLTDQQALSQGAHTWTVRAYDAAGLSVTAARRTIKVDTSNPSGLTLISPPDKSWSNQSEFILNWSAAKDSYGEVCGYRLVLDQGEPILIAVTSISDVSYRTGPLAEEGDHTWFVAPVDCAGHQGTSTVRWTIRIDRTPPAAPVLQRPENGEFVSDKRPPLRWSAPDDGPAQNPSGICRYSITIGGDTFETTSDGTEYIPDSDLPDGSISWSVRAIDWAQIIGPASVANTFTVDSTPPEISALPAEGCYRAPFTISLGLNEAGTIHYTTDGTKPSASSPEYKGPIEVSSEKDFFLTVAGFDRAWNKSADKTLHYILDVTPALPDINPLPPFWDGCRVGVTTWPTATDAMAGKITGTTPDPLIYTHAGTYSITWTYDDGHGNTSTQMQTIILAAPWAPPAADMQYTMIISGTAYDDRGPASGPGILPDGTPSDGDWIGAFGPAGESDCRAVGKIQEGGHYDLIIGAYQDGAYQDCAYQDGDYQVGLDGNQAESAGNQPAGVHEAITFKLLRCSDDKTMDSLESALFVSGDIRPDQELHFGICSQTIEFMKGWNWVSFHVIPFDTSLGAVFGDYAGSVRQIKTQTKSATNVPGGSGWIGDDLNLLATISKGAMFKIEATEGFTLQVIGTCTAPDLPIEVQKGWTWIAYLPGMCLSVEDAGVSVFGDLYQIKGQTQSRVKLPDYRFIGDLIQMCPGKGYTVKMNSNRTLIYPGP